MKKSKMYGIALRHPRRTEFALVSLFFGLLAALFMGPILFHFGSAVHGYWGDGTGGLIWLINLDLPPFGGTTDAVVYPYGDNLFRPDLITASFFILPFWAASQLIGAVATWNLIIFASFWLCGVSMYYLVKRLTSHRMAALWAGVAFAYLPMHQYKAFGHIAYVLTFVFVFVLWQVLNFAEKPSRRNAFILGLVFSAPFYIDGYYVLFTLILVGIPLLYMLLKRAWKLSKKTVDEFKSFIVSLVVFFGTSIVALLPIIYCKIVYGAQISAGLALARGDFMSNVKVYTARWYDFVMPIETHPVFGKWATDFRLGHNHGSNTSEHTLYLGLVVVGLAAWTAYFFWKRRNAAKEAKKATKVKPEVIFMLLLVAFVAFLIMLPPYFTLMGQKVPMPSGVLSVFVQYWRVYARLVIIVHLLLVVVGGIGLAILLNRFRSRLASRGLALLLILITFFEYLSFNPFHRQDIWYYDKLSPTNSWLAKQKDIKVIAVYPLVDQPDGLAGLYTTEQKINGKKMINAGTVTTKQARLRASITGLNDPQTLPVLKALGAQAVMTHEIGNDRTIPGLHLAYGASDMPAGYAADVDLFRFKDVVAAKYALVASSGFKDMIYADLSTKHFVNGDGPAELRVESMPGVQTDAEKMHRVQFGLNTTDGYRGNDIVLMQDERVIDVIHMGANDRREMSYDIREGSSLRIQVVGQLKPDSLYINKLRTE